MSKKRPFVAEQKAHSWSTHFDRTWLSSQEACRALDWKIAQLVGAHWGRRGPDISPELVLPLRCEATADLLRSLGKSPSNAIHCTILLALLGESLLCAELGGILRKERVDRFADNIHERRVKAEALRLLRNAVCHPAAASKDRKDKNKITALSDFLESHFRDWALDLRGKPGRLADREVAFFALHLVDSLGQEQAAHWDVRLPDAKRR